MSAHRPWAVVAACVVCLSPVGAQRPVALENQLLLFVRGSRLHVRDLSAQTERPLHPQIPVQNVIAWRSDGLRALTRREGDVFDLVDVATGSVSPFPHVVQAASFSPDGGHVAFVEGGHLFVRDLATGQVTPPGAPLAGLAVKPDTGSPAWNADGGRIAFVGTGAGGQAALRVLVPGQPVANVPLVTAADIRDPVWTPDGRWIYYASGTRLERIDVAGRNVQTIDKGRGTAALPVVAANGSRLAYLRGGNPEGQVRVVHRPQGRLPRMVTTWAPFSGPRLRPSWSSDGRVLVFSTQGSNLHTTSVDGEEVDTTSADEGTPGFITSRIPPPEGKITGATGDPGDPIVVELEIKCLEEHHELLEATGTLASQMVVHAYDGSDPTTPETPSVHSVPASTLTEGKNNLPSFTLPATKTKFSVSLILVVRDDNVVAYGESKVDVATLNALFTWQPGQDATGGAWILETAAPGTSPLEGVVTGASGAPGDPTTVQLEIQSLEAHEELLDATGTLASQMVIHRYDASQLEQPETPSMHALSASTLTVGTNDLPSFTLPTTKTKFSVSLILVVRDNDVDANGEAQVEVAAKSALFSWQPGEDASAGSWILETVVPQDCPEDG